MREIVLKSGRVIFANEGIIGINDEGVVRHGYDSCVPGLSPMNPEEESDWTDKNVLNWLIT
jgi:hypothetical protein